MHGEKKDKNRRNPPLDTETDGEKNVARHGSMQLQQHQADGTIKKALFWR